VPVATDLRRKILDASIELVAEQGVRAVSFREVARRAGVSHQTPYHHFGDHLGILHAIAREGFAGLDQAMRDAAARAGADAVARLQAAGIAYVGFARKRLGHFRVMFQRTLVDLHDRGDPIPEADATFATLMRLAEQVHQAGRGGGLSVEEIGHLSWSTVHGLSVLVVEGTLSESPRRDLAVARQVVTALSRLFDRPSRR
jgi:AcrR family transcriptional regulator